MNKLFALIAILCFAIAILQSYYPKHLKRQADSIVQKEMNLARIDPLADDMPTSGYLEDTRTGKTYSESLIQRYIEKSDRKKALTWYWHFGNKYNIAASGMGTDEKHHFANAYLKDYVPFETDQFWMPLYAISMKLTYQLDSKQYGGLEDIWQTSVEAYANTRGDCEDHAILLADWLNGIDIEARVVIGSYDGGGHAWVVAFMDGKEYLLEATSKRRVSKWKHYPLAKLIDGYKPKYMFNKDTFWTNMGSTNTRSYSGKQWKKVSKYIEAY